MCLNQPDQSPQFASADLAGFVHQDDRIAWELFCHEKLRKYLRSQAVLLQVVHLLALRRDYHDRAARTTQAALDLLQRETLSSARAAAEQRDEISARKNLVHGGLLLRRQHRRHGEVCCERRKTPPAPTSRHHNVQFAA